eukprot:gene28451-7041_t
MRGSLKEVSAEFRNSRFQMNSRKRLSPMGHNGSLVHRVQPATQEDTPAFDGISHQPYTEMVVE